MIHLRPDILPEADPPAVQIIDKSTPIAAKAYACSVCGKAIPRGRRHEKVIFKDEDGKFGSIRAHIGTWECLPEPEDERKMEEPNGRDSSTTCET